MIQDNSKNSSARGGARKGAGRKRGAATKKTREIADKAAEEGITPLEYLLAVMREKAEHEDPKIQCAREAMKFQAAVAAAPYIHPRLQAIEHSGSIDTIMSASDEQLDAQIKERAAQVGLTLQ